MADFKYGELTEKIIGAAFRVHGTLGNGFQEVIYQRALDSNLEQWVYYMQENLKWLFFIWINRLAQDELIF